MNRGVASQLCIKFGKWRTPSDIRCTSSVFWLKVLRKWGSPLLYYIYELAIVLPLHAHECQYCPTFMILCGSNDRTAVKLLILCRTTSHCWKHIKKSSHAYPQIAKISCRCNMQDACEPISHPKFISRRASILTASNAAGTSTIIHHCFQAIWHLPCHQSVSLCQPTRWVLQTSTQRNLSHIHRTALLSIFRHQTHYDSEEKLRPGRRLRHCVKSTLIVFQEEGCDRLWIETAHK